MRRSDCLAGDGCRSLMMSHRPTAVGFRFIAAASLAVALAVFMFLCAGCASVGGYERRADGARCRPVRRFPWLVVDRYECYGAVR